MSAFRPGWYEVGFDAATRDRHCRYFKTAECLAEHINQPIPARPDNQVSFQRAP